MKSPEELLKELIDACDNALPYVEATIHPASTFPINNDSDWIQVHGARTRSSHKFITDLQKTVNEIREDLKNK